MLNETFSEELAEEIGKKQKTEMGRFYSFSRKCLICNQEFQNIGRWKKHIFDSHPEEYIDVILKNFSIDYKEDPFAWKILKELILKRDNRTCQICGKRAEVVHHKKYHNCQKEDLESLCDDCHRKQPIRKGWLNGVYRSFLSHLWAHDGQEGNRKKADL